MRPSVSSLPGSLVKESRMEPELVLRLMLPGGMLKGESLVTPAPYCSRSLPWKPGMAAHACNLSTWEAEARRIATNRKKLAWATE